MEKPGFVYIMANKRKWTIYIGVTSNLVKRTYQHRTGMIEGFTKQYGCRLLVWFEASDSIQAARARELQMKKSNRAWKLRAIEERNPEWRDFYADIRG